MIQCCFIIPSENSLQKSKSYVKNNKSLCNSLSVSNQLSDKDKFMSPKSFSYRNFSRFENINCKQLLMKDMQPDITNLKKKYPKQNKLFDVYFDPQTGALHAVPWLK